MNATKALRNRIRGWLPKELSTAGLQNGFKLAYKQGLVISAFGMGVSELVLWTAFLLGLYKNQMLFFATQAVIITVDVLVLALVYWLGIRLAKRKAELPNRGWLPKENSFPSNQSKKVWLVDYFMRYQFVRFVYGLMLSGLLFTPFLFYYSRAEPYIMGTLWGYQVPIGYVGFLLGILTIAYPRFTVLKNLRFSTIMAVTGLSLLVALIFNPSDYLINLLNGTSFTPGQMDVEASLGSIAVVWISFLSITVALVWSAILGFRKKLQPQELKN